MIAFLRRNRAAAIVVATGIGALCVVAIVQPTIVSQDAGASQEADYRVSSRLDSRAMSRHTTLDDAVARVCESTPGSAGVHATMYIDAASGEVGFSVRNEEAEAVPGADAAVETGAAVSTEAVVANLARQCLMAMVSDPAPEWLSTIEQRDAAYDYFTSWLVPCLSLTGYPLVGEMPSRVFFQSDGLVSLWTPYWSIRGTDAPETEWIRSRCPEYPTGLGSD